jgi:hypothetical protein
MIYSKERRGEVLAACDAGKGTREVALLFVVSESWVRRIKQERRESGKVAPKLTRDRTPIGCGSRSPSVPTPRCWSWSRWRPASARGSPRTRRSVARYTRCG